MKWKSARVGSKFKSKIPTAIRLSCSSLLAIEESQSKPKGMQSGQVSPYHRLTVRSSPTTDSDRIITKSKHFAPGECFTTVISPDHAALSDNRCGGKPCHIPRPYPVSPLEKGHVQVGATEWDRQARAGMEHSSTVTHPFWIWRKSMKRTFALILAVVAAAALFGGLVHAVLVAAQVSEQAATTVYGLTSRRLWAAAVTVLALAGVVIGGLALARPASRFGIAWGR